MAEHAVQDDADAPLLRLGAQAGELLRRAQQRVGLEIVGGVVPVVGVGLEDGVEVDAGDAQIGQVGQLLADALKVAAEVVPVQVAVLLLVGPEIGLAVLLFPVDAVGKAHGLARHPFAETVGEDLVHGAVGDPVRRLVVRLVDGQLPLAARHPGKLALAVCAAEDLAEIGVQVKVIKVQPGGGGAHPHRKMVDVGGLAFKLHAVVDRVLAVFGQHQVGVHIAQFLRRGQPEHHLGPCRDRAEGLLVRRVGAVVVYVCHRRPPCLSLTQRPPRHGAGFPCRAGSGLGHAVPGQPAADGYRAFSFHSMPKRLLPLILPA